MTVVRPPIPALSLLLALLLVLPFDPAAAQRAPSEPAPVQREPSEPAPAETKEEPFEPDARYAELQGLDKETARIRTFGGRVGDTVRFRTLDIAIRRCQRTPPDKRPEKAAFLQIHDTDPESGDRTMVFSGWMFKSRPALSAMDHPIYDVWLKDCR